MAREIDLGSIVGPQGPAGADGAKWGKVDTSLTAGSTAPDGYVSGDWLIDSKYDIYQVNASGNLEHKGNIKGQDGAGVSTAEDVAYGDSTVKQALDDLLYTAINITSFSNNQNTVEMGRTIDTVNLTWAINKTPIELTLDGASIDVSLRAKTVENAGIKTDKTWTLVATDDRNAKSTKTTNVLFRNGIYYGTGNASGDAINDAFVAGLKKELSNSRARTFNVTAATGDYIYYILPARLGTPKFKVGGFDGGFSLVKTFDYNNPSGYSESYNVYRSDNASLGAQAVTVS